MRIFFFFLLYLTLTSHSQSIINNTMGKVTLEELKMSNYSKDSTAPALILSEKGHVYPSKKKKYNYTKDYYIKIKFFNNEALDKATIEIPYYKNSKLEKIEGVTYNLSETGEIIKTPIQDKDINYTKHDKYTQIKSFILPNVKKGSVIEYKYSISVNNYGIYDWYFQSDIPKLKTQYALNFYPSSNFKIRSIGYLTPSKDTNKDCGKKPKCPKLVYKMKDVPAFKKEPFLTSEENFISRLSFERAYIFDPYVKKDENREWNTLDKFFKKTYDEKLNKKSFYKRKIPDSVLTETNELSRAKKVFYFIQNHFTLNNNDKLYFYQTYKEKKGTAHQINLSLYNALKAANIENVNLVRLSTRTNGFVTKLYASVTDFNYTTVLAKINGKKYLLDATNKKYPFGLIPFKCLNGDGRVLDFKKGSYWEPIISNAITSNLKTILKLRFHPNDNVMKGKLKIISNGYYALKKRTLNLYPEKELLVNKIESEFPNITIDSAFFTNQDILEKSFKENYKIQIENVLENNRFIKIGNLLPQSSAATNPFKLKERKYPIDFGYSNQENFRVSIAIPKNISIVSIPENKSFKLPNNDAKFLFKVEQGNNILTINFLYSINKKVFLVNEYENLKRFYNEMVKAQNSFIELKKK